MLAPVVIVGVALLFLLAAKSQRGHGLLAPAHLASLDFPVVIRQDDGAMVYCRTPREVFSHFEPQDLDDPQFFGWDSAGRRFCLAGWSEHGQIRVDTRPSWDDFNLYLEAAYEASPEIAAWRSARF